MTFDCPHCGQSLECDEDMAGDVVECPACTKPVTCPGKAEPPTIPAATRRLPLTIKPSPRALCARFIESAVQLAVVVGTAGLVTVALHRAGTFDQYAALMGIVWLILIAVFVRACFRLWIAHRRIKNTEYRVYANKIEMTSFAFRFLGARNNTANLAQLRQIQAHRNGLLDLWFFGCGRITLTVSGDVSDFTLTDIFEPEQAKRTIEEIAFGADSVGDGQASRSEVG